MTHKASIRRSTKTTHLVVLFLLLLPLLVVIVFFILVADTGGRDDHQERVLETTETRKLALSIMGRAGLLAVVVRLQPLGDGLVRRDCFSVFCLLFFTHPLLVAVTQDSETGAVSCRCCCRRHAGRGNAMK
jgi:hypothetical protein